MRMWRFSLKKSLIYAYFFNLYLTVPTTSTNHPYEPKWECQAIPDICENSDYIIANTFDSTRHPAVLVYPYCSPDV